MRLSARILINYVNNNIWEYTDYANVRAGEIATVYLQLVDLDRKGQRYIPEFSPSLLSLTVSFNSIDDSKAFSLPCGIVDTHDQSIWSFTLGTIQVPSSGNIFFNYIENSIQKNFYLLDALKVEQTSIVGAC